MQVEKYLKNYQPTIYKTFVQAMEKGKLSHAYLLVGSKGVPLLEIATFLAKSLLCDEPSPLACNNCISCLRVDDNNYPDCIILDGAEKLISKDAVDTISHQFERTPLETKGIMVYVLNCIEYMREEAINSILKFLEEPQEGVYAFLTTNNENAILPTIVSRCQTLHLKAIDRNLVIEQAVDLGVEKGDAELLSYFYNDGELIYEIINNEEESEYYFACKKALEELLNALKNGDNDYAVYYVQSKISPLVNKKESFRFFLDCLITVFEDLLNIQNNRPITLTNYDTILQDILDNNHIDVSSCLLELLKQRNMIGLNLNIPLQLDHIILSIVRSNINESR
ncbi:MAG: hypothetical protein E7178_05020 [Erysipelotrichaceae bacterium]|nr:hypothetical protein [Erysipelotrichaceae bacterium]